MFSMNLITYKIFLTVLEARNLKSVLLSIVKVLAGSIPSRFSEEDSVSFHFVAFGSHLDSMAQTPS